VLNNRLGLNPKLFDRDVERKSTRDGYGEGLVVAGVENENVVVLTADLKESTRSQGFSEKFPDRFIEVGVAEQNLASVASGMAAYGKIPFISSFACFSPYRNWEQIRTTIALNNVPVKIGGSHTGLSASADGATHQALEDIALMRVLPNMIVVAPCDAIETRKAIVTAAKNGKPTYIRFSRSESPVLTTEDTPFDIGKVETFWSPSTSSGRLGNPEVAIVACGPIIYEALLAAKKLEENGINSLVINCHTIKPLDEQEIIKASKITGAVVTVEEHQIAGGLGSAVAEVLAKNFPIPMEFVSMPDSFGESGKHDELLEKYGMKRVDIEGAVRKVIGRKNS